jgi:ATP-binding protein involved in chromosome partitioning
MAVTEQQILETLKQVKDPELGRDVISLGMIKDLALSGGKVSLTLELTTPACPVREQFEQDLKNALTAVPGVTQVELKTTAQVRAVNSFGPQSVPGVRNLIAVASGKGGVGKSTVSVNLAVALARDGARVGLMDADIYGPNVPLMMGLDQLPALKGEKIVPAENFGVKVMSMGFLVKPDEAIIWRGPMLHGAITKFLKEVEWGELDYLLIDLPPGTGDVQLSLSQVIAMSGAVIVTTPQDVALMDVRKSITMFEKVKVPLLGVIENMSSFICPHCSKTTDIFDKGGGAHAAEQLKIPFLGEIPLLLQVREGADSGHPVVLTHPDSPASQAFVQIARRLAARVSVLAVEAPVVNPANRFML